MKYDIQNSKGLALRWHGDAPWQSPKWTIRNRLPETGAGLLVGQWGMLKTYAALDLSAHVMMGWDWTGEPVYRQAGVLALAQEGAGSIPMRLAALVEHKIEPRIREEPNAGAVWNNVKPERLPFAWADSCPMLLGTKDGNPMPVLLDTAEEAHVRFMKDFGLPLGLIWIDTMSSAGGWTDEQDNAEAARLMSVLRTLSSLTVAAVMGVDHLGKNVDAGARGASAKEANSDFVLALLGTKDLAGNITDMRLALRKIREGPSGQEIPVAPKVVAMGNDERGYALTSVVLDWNVKRATTQTKSNSHQILDDSLAGALAEHGKTVKSADGVEVRAVARMYVLNAFKAAYKSGKNTTEDNKRSRFRDALRKAEGLIAAETINGVVYLWPAEVPF